MFETDILASAGPGFKLLIPLPRLPLNYGSRAPHVVWISWIAVSFAAVGTFSKHLPGFDFL